MQKETREKRPGLMLCQTTQKASIIKTDYSVQKKRMLETEKTSGQRKDWRNGYTNRDTCAAAAAKAAALLLCGKRIRLFGTLPFRVELSRRIQVTRYEPEQETESPAFCPYCVQKDSGDDPMRRMELKGI